MAEPRRYPLAMATAGLCLLISCGAASEDPAAEAKGNDTSVVLTDAASGVATDDAGAAPTGVDGRSMHLGVDVKKAQAATCSSWCAVLLKNCTGHDEQFVSVDGCKTWCKDKGKLAAGDPGSWATNTVTCRQHYAELAGANATRASNLCPAAGPTGAGVCGTWCDVYCHLAGLYCVAGDAKLYGHRVLGRGEEKPEDILFAALRNQKLYGFR